MMSSRSLTKNVDPAAYKPMLALEKYIAESPLDKVHYELIKIRASQLNGCSYCLNMHSKDARKLGVSEQKIYLLSAWKETPFYTDEERSILALTEEITLIANHGVSDEVYNKAVEVLGEAYTKVVLMAVITINAWNRIGITDQLMPE